MKKVLKRTRTLLITMIEELTMKKTLLRLAFGVALGLSSTVALSERR